MLDSELMNLRTVHISELKQNEAILDRLRQIREHLQKEANGRSASFIPSEFGPETRFNLFPRIGLEDLEDYLDNDELEISHRDPKAESCPALPYRVYSVPSTDTSLINALENADCEAYHRVLLQAPDGVLTRDFGEIREPHSLAA